MYVQWYICVSHSVGCHCTLTGGRHRYTEDIELEDAIHTAILTLKEGFEGQIASDNIEIGIVGKDQKFR